LERILVKLSFDLSITGSGKSWFATCEVPGATGQGTVSGQGTASSKDVAASRALQNCIKALEDIEEPEEPVAPPPAPVVQGDSRVGRRYSVLKGRREGETCTFLRHVGTREDSSENWDVKYDDGTIGLENSRFLMAVR
jgi:hypothetical protein